MMISVHGTSAQSISNAGTEFWSVFPTHQPNSSTELATNSIFITSSQASSGVVTCGTFSTTFSVTPNTVVEVPIPRAISYINATEGNTVLKNRAIHIVVDAGKPKVVVYSHIFAGKRSAASLILPKDALSQKYFSMNYQELNQQSPEGQNYIAIVATQANTTVHIKRGTTELVPGGVTLTNVNDVYEYLVTPDLTGVSVSVDTLNSACKSFAMFSGSSGAYISTATCSPASLDPLFQQCYPIESWGMAYGFVPFSTNSPNFTFPVRTVGQYARIVAKDDNTVVRIDGTAVATLNSGQFYTTPSPLQSASYITGSKPISVAQYALTQACATTGRGVGYSDPDMVILNPINYNIKNITVYSSTKQVIEEEYINVLIKTSAAASFRINNAVPTGSFFAMPTLPGYSYMQLDLTKLNTGGTKSFNLTADDGFNAIAYGFGNVESYSYSAGTSLASSQTVSTIKSSDNTVIDSACVNENFFFKLTLPFKSPQITWNMDPADAPVVQTSPTAKADTTNGIISYLYTLPKTPAYNTAGSHKYNISAQYPTTQGGCATGSQDISGTFFVVPLPVVSFTHTPEACHSIIDFKDKSTSQVGSVNQYLWDFGDPNNKLSSNTSTLANPIHAYADSGLYYVKETVTSTTGCQTFKIDTVRILQHITLDFSTPNLNCSNSAVTFTDQSTTIDFTVVTRKWFFGDGSSDIVNNGPTVSHQYLKSGNYNVKLVLVSNTGCQSDTITKQVVISASPIAKFNIPGVCAKDSYAQFIDESAMSDNSTVTFKYHWDFGDINNSAHTDTSSQQFPKYYYNTIGKYTVTLTITAPSGCTDVTQKTFEINGGTPKADFDIINTGPVCSGQPVMILNKSTVAPGVITKIEIFYDNVNQPTVKTIIDTPGRFEGNIFSHVYTLYNRLPDSKDYDIKLKAYSGGVCVDSLTRTVTILPVPKVKFDALDKICFLATPVQLTQGSETTGIQGTGTYSGDGVSLGGLFNPAIAGVGIHVITYKFTSTFGCVDSLTQPITVLTSPRADAGETLYVLEGKSVVLKPTVSGNNLTFSWDPSETLSRSDVLNPVAKPTETTKYTLTVSNGTCEDTSSVRVVVLRMPIIPNTFTPNADGTNDTWFIKYLADYPKATIQIFNRYGTQIYYSLGYGKPWDGTYNGTPVPVGTYYYSISPKNGQINFAGSVTVIR
ncbi:gliding motility-associated C-terminal domain-containing protein [Mucilaginibacter sp. HMF5004]|uniref:PKD domain-containing protein n=1 Tax=Mucilaginibacter rivuli TaxID=2857527 RepID=UPI001C5EB1F4|nr:gliding motility-associated C-terminal domain-containing protein [Mucilaginibacter rivuli]MBW4889637.1 gliding motility-associated C-terminal domain-containing protein [Mucilaginibacter rivuli]